MHSMKSVNKYMLIRTMLTAGLTQAVITSYLGLTRRKVEYISKNMKENEGFVYTCSNQKVRRSGDILKSREASFEASIVMQIYTLLNDRYREIIAVDSLLPAYDLYSAFRNDIGLHSKNKLSVMDIWGLAQDLTQEEAMVITCPQCDTKAYVSIDQKVYSLCPVCPAKEQTLKHLVNI